MKRWTRVRHLTLSEVWALVCIVLPATALLLPRLSAIDLAYLVRAGETMIRSHHLMARDLFTFTSYGRSWLNQQWGSELLFATVHRWGGWSLLLILRAALAGVIAWCVYGACRSRGAGQKLASGLTLGSFGVLLPGLILRPQILGMVMFAFTLLILARRGRHPGRVWLVVPIVALWANLHGSFFLGPALVAFAFLEDRLARRPGATRLATVAAVSAVAANLNPFGVRVWSYALGISTNKVITATIQEWRPPTLRTEPGIVFFLSVAVVMIVLARSRETIPAATLVQLAAFFVIGLYAVRGIYWWAMVAPILLAPILAQRFPGPVQSEERIWINSAIAAMLALVMVVFLPWWRTGEPQGQTILLDHAPAGVTAALHRVVRPGDRIFDPQIWGSWFEYEFPQARVFVDSRIEISSASVWDDYDAVSGGRQGWQRILDRWGIDVVVASRAQQAGLLALLKQDMSWREIFSDASGTIAVRA